jgi:hypothetical protein
MPKEERGLGLFDVQAWNKGFLAKQLWNIHLKTDSIWIRWVHHFYLSTSSIWNAVAYHTSSPLWNSIVSIRDLILESYGSQAAGIALMKS